MLADVGSLRDFLRAAKGRSQEDIIIEFLATAVVSETKAEQGSVLINHPRGQKLIVFNEGDFLFERKILDEQSSWPREFTYFEGIAGRCFRTRRTQIFRRSQVGSTADFFGSSPIQNMVCVPIITVPGEPFGVVCFHNNDPDRAFSDSEVEALESYVDVLAIALHTPLPELNLEKNVFIVHGRDRGALDEFELLLRKYDVQPKVLVNTNTGPNSVLEELEALIRVCKAGFILATPDDEGRLQGDNGPLIGRARQNVIFETGLLFAKFRRFERVALVVKKPLELPSDLHGIFYLEFEDSVRELETPIVDKLNGWGIPTRARN